MVEFRDANLAESSNWDDYAEVLDFAKQYPTDELEDFTDPHLFVPLFEEAPDKAEELILYLSENESPSVQSEAGKIALDFLKYDQDRATPLVRKLLEKAAEGQMSEDFINYARDVFELSGTDTLEDINLRNLATIIRTYKNTKNILFGKS